MICLYRQLMGLGVLFSVRCILLFTFVNPQMDLVIHWSFVYTISFTYMTDLLFFIIFYNKFSYLSTYTFLKHMTVSENKKLLWRKRKESWLFKCCMSVWRCFCWYFGFPMCNWTEVFKTILFKFNSKKGVFELWTTIGHSGSDSLQFSDYVKEPPPLQTCMFELFRVHT